MRIVGKLVFAFATMAAGTYIAADSTDTNALAKAERRRIRREQKVANEGGIVVKPQSGKVVRFVDAQERIGRADVEQAAESLKDVINMPIETVAAVSSPDSLALARTVSADKMVGAAVLLIEDKKLPPVIVAPECSWAIVNVTALAADFPPKEVLSVRVRKELVRAATWALGAGESMMKPCIMQYEPTLAALDANPMEIPSPDPRMRMVNGAMARGINTIRQATYKQACEEGWAPAPTNDVQKAIWDKVKADKERGPTNPITIPPPKANAK